MKAYELIINGKIKTFLSREIFEKLPEDSMLYTLLRDDQPLRTQNVCGQYELTLDHPKLFDIAIQSALDERFGFASMSSMLKSAGYDFEEGLAALEQTMNYLGLSPNDNIKDLLDLKDLSASFSLNLESYRPLLELELELQN